MCVYDVNYAEMYPDTVPSFSFWRVLTFTFISFPSDDLPRSSFSLTPQDSPIPNVICYTFSCSYLDSLLLWIRQYSQDFFRVRTFFIFVLIDTVTTWFYPYLVFFFRLFYEGKRVFATVRKKFHILNNLVCRKLQCKIHFERWSMMPYPSLPSPPKPHLPSIL